MPTRRLLKVKSQDETKAAAFGALLEKLAKFLETLTVDELADIPTAAEALAQLRGARATIHPRRSQPVEVVFARDGHEIVAALLLRRRWMERAFDESHSRPAEGPSDAGTAFRGASALGCARHAIVITCSTPL
jgi:hypothetical protein